MIRLTVIISLVLCASGVLLARRIGAERPGTLSRLLTTPEGAPCACLLGVIPGETSFENAITILDSHPLLSGQLKRIRGAGSEVQYLSRDTFLLLAGDLRGGVATIQLQAYLNTEYLNVPSWAGILPNRITLGDVITLYGNGALVEPLLNDGSVRGMGAVRIFFPDQRLAVVAQYNGYEQYSHLRPDSAITFFSLSADVWYEPRWKNDLSYTVDWFGFTTVQRYTDRLE
jgi:hypothetical protein